MSNKKVIDISQHQGYIDFEKVKADGIKDVIIRVGWIGNKNNHTLDTYFESYYQKAVEYGFNIGFYVYSYCTSIETLKSGTEWLLKQIKSKKASLPVFLDLEDKQIYNIGKNELTNQAVEFCKMVQNQGFKSGIYASKYWFTNKLDINQLLDYKIWLAEWNGKENHTLPYKVDLWQYSSTGKVNGITGNVDMNKCLCNCDEKQEYIEKDEEDFEMAKTYKNGSTKETVYADSNLSIKIGSLNVREQCECLGIVNGRYIVKYKIDGSNNYKVGFVKYNGGIK